MIGRLSVQLRIALAGVLGLAVGCGLGFGLASSSTAPEEIRIQADAFAAQVEDREAMFDVRLTSEEKQAMLDRIVQQEILVREAEKLGLHRKNADIRKHLIALMNHVMFTEAPEPTDAQLRALYEVNPERYMLPESVTFEHVFFGEDKGAADEIAAAARAGAEIPDSAGQKFWLGRRMEGYYYAQLLTVLGHEFTRSLKSLPVGEWAGPVRSGRGWHLVRIEAFHPPKPLPAEERARRLREDWKKDAQASNYGARIAEMSRNYSFVLPDIDRPNEHAEIEVPKPIYTVSQ